MTQVKEPWNRCDACGKFISYDDFDNGKARRQMIYPDSEHSDETWETLCAVCYEKEAQV